MYLFEDFRGIQMLEDEKELKHNLLIACAEWLYSSNYSSDNGVKDTPLSLYEYCMKDEDFGDIAQVYLIYDWYGLPRLGEKSTIKRIL